MVLKRLSNCIMPHEHMSADLEMVTDWWYGLKFVHYWFQLGGIA